MNRALWISERGYGLTRVCTAWGGSRATMHRHRLAPSHPDAPRLRAGPDGTISDTDLAVDIRAVLVDSPFQGEGYRKVWAKIGAEIWFRPRHADVRTSSKRVLRIMREQSLLAHQRSGRHAESMPLA